MTYTREFNAYIQERGVLGSPSVTLLGTVLGSPSITLLGTVRADTAYEANRIANERWKDRKGFFTVNIFVS